MVTNLSCWFDKLSAAFVGSVEVKFSTFVDPTSCPTAGTAIFFTANSFFFIASDVTICHNAGRGNHSGIQTCYRTGKYIIYATCLILRFYVIGATFLRYVRTDFSTTCFPARRITACWAARITTYSLNKITLHRHFGMILSI